MGLEDELLDWFASLRNELQWFGRPGFGGFQVPGPIGIDSGGDAGTTTTAKNKKAPPKTKPGPAAIKVSQPPVGIAYVLTVEVLDDAVDSTIESTGRTNISWKDFHLDPPVPEYETTSGLAIVSNIKTNPKGTGVLTIQTKYQRKGAQYLISGYGRGTTRDDIKAGNITLGFHESCHRDDFIKYLNTQKLPDFDGTVGMPAEEFNQHWEDFTTAFSKLPHTIGEWSKPLTDDVGIAKATFDARHKKKAASAGSKH